MARSETREELFAGHNVLALCHEDGHASRYLDTALLNAEKAARLGLFAISGLISESEGCRAGAPIHALCRHQLRHAADVYWKREAPKGDTPEEEPAPARDNVVALPPRPGA